MLIIISIMAHCLFNELFRYVEVTIVQLSSILQLKN